MKPNSPFGEQIREVVRYGLKGGATMLLNIACMVALVDGLGVRATLAAIASTSFVIAVGYLTMNAFVFPDADAPPHRRRLPSYLAVILTSKGVNYVLFLGLLSVGVWYPLAWVGGALVVFVGTFTANRWVWTSGTGA